ncbi:MAG: hypothetical protein EXR39_11940 [Betaproteobacteria bacterium]|nr:hypothetical protein [Betaproteobacteria bacterium]
METSEELALLRGIGCDTAQGFLFAKPMEAEHFLRWASDWRQHRQQSLFSEPVPVTAE